MQREDTLKIGADIYVNTSSPDELKAAENTLDYLIITINAAVDWDPYMAAMRPNGAIAFVGAIPKPIEIPVFGILMKNVCKSDSTLKFLYKYSGLSYINHALLLSFSSLLLEVTSEEVKT